MARPRRWEVANGVDVTLAMPRTLAPSLTLTALALMVAAILGAWGFELIGGFAPCPLCLEQRSGYYVAIPLAVAGLLATDGTAVARLLALAAALAIAWSAAFGVYHAGAEWGFWPGPDTCAAADTEVRDASSLMAAINATPVVSCTAVQGRVLGLSFAGWNALAAGTAALLLLAAALAPMRRAPTPVAHPS